MKQDSDQVQYLKERYKAGLIEKSEQVTVFIEFISTEPSEAFDSAELQRTIVEMHEFLHKLAGSAGMYCYDDIALSSRQIMGDIKLVSSAQMLSEARDKLIALRDLLDKHS